MSEIKKNTQMISPLELIGKTIAEANAICVGNGYTLRVMEKDGEPLMGTCDLRSNRVNVAVADGKVIGLQNIG